MQKKKRKNILWLVNADTLSLGLGYDMSGGQLPSGRGGYSKSGNEGRFASVHSTVASDEDVIQLLLLSERSRLEFSFKKAKKKKQWGMHPINKRRRSLGEYPHLLPQLKGGSDRFFEYTRMSIQMFDFILNKLKPSLEKKRPGLRQQVQPEERLVVTLS